MEIGMAAKTLLTLKEFNELPDNGVRYELDEGELAPMTFPRPKYQRVAKRILIVLERYLERHPIGEAFLSDTGFVLSENPATLRGPDVSFLGAKRVEDVDPNSDIPGAPDLAVEVVSPSDSAAELTRKVNQYLKAGSHTVWVVYPDERQVLVFERSGIVRIVSEEQALDAPALLPGFSVPVSSLFV
jgi:Uma2 family endonuclease